MNKNLIGQLAYKVLLKTGTPTGSDEWQQLFAELIVAECMSIAQEYDGSKLGGPGLIIAMRIEQHFGVEE